MKLALFAIGFGFGVSAHAAQVACHTDDATRQRICIQPTAVTANGSLRASPVFMGGPKGVEKTGYMMVVDCQKNITTLQDRKGVNFAGGAGNDTAALRALGGAMCEAKSPKKDAQLKQFGS